jgi:hypothetical protein
LAPRFLIAAGFALCARAALAAPNEIKVFTDELAGYGQHALEAHVNKGRTPLQVMPEYSYGIRRYWELSLQLPMAFSGEASRTEGYRTEMQYIAPHDAYQGLYWGFNLELARIARIGEPRFSNVEIIPIVGLRAARWHLVANPGFDRALSGKQRATSFQPAAKVAYRGLGRNDYGFEYYEESRVLYAAWDGKLGKSDINLGIGRGLANATDRWVLKLIYEFAF